MIVNFLLLNELSFIVILFYWVTIITYFQMMMREMTSLWIGTFCYLLWSWVTT